MIDGKKRNLLFVLIIKLGFAKLGLLEITSKTQV